MPGMRRREFVVRAPAAFRDSSDNHRGASTRPIDRIIWLPSPRQWFAVQS